MSENNTEFDADPESIRGSDLPKRDSDGNYLRARQRKSLYRQTHRALEEKVTVADLREALDELDDDTLVAVSASGAWNWADRIVETETKLGHPVVKLEE